MLRCTQHVSNKARSSSHLSLNDTGESALLKQPDCNVNSCSFRIFWLLMLIHIRHSWVYTSTISFRSVQLSLKVAERFEARGYTGYLYRVILCEVRYSFILKCDPKRYPSLAVEWKVRMRCEPSRCEQAAGFTRSRKTQYSHLKHSINSDAI